MMRGKNGKSDLNTDKGYGIIGIGEGCEKLIGDFRYVFDDLLPEAGDTIIYEERSEKILKKYNSYICCTYERSTAKRRLREAGLVYKQDYLFAEDLFYLLDDRRKCRIAYKAYPGGFKDRIRAVVFGYMAKHGKIPPRDRYREVLHGDYGGDSDEHSRRRTPLREQKFLRRLIYAWYFFLGAIESIPQIRAEKNAYKDYDYICFSSVSDAIRFKEDHPTLSDKVVTAEELKSHTMASLYMKAVYFDIRQLDCSCDIPFHTIWIGDGGTTRLCDCPEFLDIGCGNAGVTDCEDIWKSRLAKIIRLSVLNHCFTFCSRGSCGKLSGKEARTMHRLPVEKTEENDHPSTIIVANDSVCNLYCPSCRKKIYAKNGFEKEKEMEACLHALLGSGWLDHADRLIIGAGGEAFLSRYYKKILYGGIVERNSIVIMTNGTLFTPQEWEKIEGKYKHVEFSVSVDAATKETYERVRRGGRYERLMENMEFLSGLRREKKVDRVKVNMIVQEANYREIPDLIRWALQLGFDGVNLSHIRNWGTFTDKEFWEQVSMFDRKGNMKAELAAVLKNPVCKDPIVSMSWEGSLF